MKRTLNLMLMVMLLGQGYAAYASDLPQVKINNSTITGVPTEYGAKYLGIPYAEPPVGDLRWRPPQAARLPKRYSATEFGSSCPQKASPLGIVGSASTDENCLYLNVYQPSGSGPLSLKPVMVWIHGGSNSYGSGNEWDPAKLVERGVIAVTVNYRLGALGFMAHPALSAASARKISGNYGILDQRLALRWVQANIAAFGGNPYNITLFGQSAGGLDTAVHLASPGSEGLFQRAIIESGTEYLIKKEPSMAEWEALGMVLAARMGCSDQSLECLQRLDVEQILQNQVTGVNAGYLPVVDGKILPRSTLAAFSSGNFNHVPLIMGTTRDELSLFAGILVSSGLNITPENYLQIMLRMGIPQEDIAAVAAEYPLKNYNSPTEALIAVGTDALYACNTRLALMILSPQVKSFGYEFNDPNAPTEGLPAMSFPYGSYHGSELFYLLDLNQEAAPLLSTGQESLSQAMVDYWTSFAAFGSPNIGQAPYWPPFDPLLQSMKSLEPPVPQTIHTYGEEHHCHFWTSLILNTSG